MSDFKLVRLAEMLTLWQWVRPATEKEIAALERESPKGWHDRVHCVEALVLADGSFLVCMHLPGFPGSDVTAPDETEINYYHVTGFTP